MCGAMPGAEHVFSIASCDAQICWIRVGRSVPTPRWRVGKCGARLSVCFSKARPGSEQESGRWLRSTRPFSLHVREELVDNAVVLALGQLIELALVIAASFRAQAGAVHALVVPVKPRGAMRQATGVHLAQRALQLPPKLEVWRVAHREVLEECCAVGRFQYVESRAQTALPRRRFLSTTA